MTAMRSLPKLAAALADTGIEAPAPGDLLSLLRALIRHEIAARPDSALAVVDAVRHKTSDADPANYDCDVHLRGRDQARFRYVPICTGHLGSVTPPREGDLVLLAFVGGDPQRPLIIGRLHNDNLRAPDFGPEEMRSLLPPDAAEDQRIDLRASAADGRRVEVLLPDAVRLIISDGRIALEQGPRTCILDQDDGSASLSAEGARLRLGDDGSVQIDGDADLTLKLSGNATIEAGGNLELKAGGSVSVNGAKIDLN